MDSLEPDLHRQARAEELGTMCMTLIEGASEDEVISRFGGDPAAAFLLSVPGLRHCVRH